MPIDPTGTKPGVVPAPPELKTVNMKCRRNGCDSIRAYVMDIGASPVRMYRCAECHHTWGINPGGAVNI